MILENGAIAQAERDRERRAHLRDVPTRGSPDAANGDCDLGRPHQCNPHEFVDGTKTGLKLSGSCMLFLPFCDIIF